MSRVNFGVEQGYEIYDVNGNLLTAQLSGSAAPGGDTGPQDDAPIGSIYQRSNGAVYAKTANAGSAADWKEIPVQLSASYTPANGDPAIGDSFEEAIEKLDGNQEDIQTASGIAQGAVDYGTFTGTTIPDNSDAKEAMQSLETAHEDLEGVVSEIDANVDDLITLSGVAENSTDLGAFTGTTIPDNSTNKGAFQALETAHEETDANVDDLITLSGVAENSTDLGSFTGSTIADNDTVKEALQDLETAYEETDQNVDDLISLSGVAENATDLGTFSGSIIPDSSTVKAALQSLETYTQAIEGGVAIQVSGVTTAQVVDSMLVDDVLSAEWEIVAWEDAAPSNKVFQKITALHNGTASADATTVDDVVHTKLKVGSNFNAVFTTSLNGAAGAQVMRLSAESSSAGISMEIRRTGILVNN